MESLIGVLQQIQEIVWGPPTMILLLITGLYYTLRLGFLQFVHLPKAIRYIFEKEEGQGVGDVSAFASLCTALAATIGTGSIVGVATALRVGGRLRGAHFASGFTTQGGVLRVRKAFSPAETRTHPLESVRPRRFSPLAGSVEWMSRRISERVGAPWYMRWLLA